LPSQGGFGHGLFNYNMKFYWSLIRCNNYRPLYVSLDSDIAPSKVPQEIIDEIEHFDPYSAGVMRAFSATDLMIVMVFQRVGDQAFKAPMDDVPAETIAARRGGRARNWLARLRGIHR
jgi:hypothetical protein